MIKHVNKEPKVSICRHCSGRGVIISPTADSHLSTCPQCLGSGRVVVSASISVEILPYIPEPGH